MRRRETTVRVRSVPRFNVAVLSRRSGGFLSRTSVATFCFSTRPFCSGQGQEREEVFYEVESGRGSGRIRLRGGLLEPRELTDSGKVGRYAVFSRCPMKIASFPSHKIGTSPENGKNWGTNKQNGVDAKS